ncbi:hypothetical protein Goshw_012113 [Gossypium schwendimanii]|uniref:Uncharacterized protein n=1 Tax=Gossypium schwendimanii TaxID=34291 RepID=A0A7J9LEZ1_GOSSC|nr:hypothetical protein [Gossypium schwendimanii]
MEERKKRSELKGKEERGRVAVHSQVRKIKQESDSEQIMDWAFGIGQPEVRPVRHQLSRSPLGLTAPPFSSLGFDPLYMWEHACMIHSKRERRICFQVTLLRGSTFALKQLEKLEMEGVGLLAEQLEIRGRRSGLNGCARVGNKGKSGGFCLWWKESRIVNVNPCNVLAYDMVQNRYESRVVTAIHKTISAKRYGDEMKLIASQLYKRRCG